MTHGSAPPSAIVVMGVQGAGKTTIGSALAAELGFEFVDADDLHSATNRAKMAAGEMLTDADREPWLMRVGSALAEGVRQGRPIVVACSALKRRYRDAIRRAAADTVFVHLTASPELIARRIASRQHEFMPAALLASQLAALEPLAPDERGVSVDVSGDTDETIRTIREKLAAEPEKAK